MKHDEVADRTNGLFAAVGAKSTQRLFASGGTNFVFPRLRWKGFPLCYNKQ